MPLPRRGFLKLAGATALAGGAQPKPHLFNAKAFQGGRGTPASSFWGVTPQRAPQPDEFAEFLRTARKRFQMAAEAEQHIRSEALEDLRFFAGEQWPDHIRTDRDKHNRPCLVINRLPQIIQQVTNQQRQARPGIQVNPVGSQADKKTAEIIQGLIRHTEVISMADIAYDTAFEHAAIMGFGYWRIRTDYVDDTSFDQDIFDEWIEDPFSVYLDPTARLADRSDMTYAFIVKDYSPDQFAADFPNAQIAGLQDFRSIGDNERFWYSTGKIRVAEYFWIEVEQRTLVALTNGQVIEDSELQDYHEIAVRDGKPLIRRAEKPNVMYTKLTALEEIEKRRRIPGKYIPILPVYGRDIIVDGKRVLAGMVRDAKDSQRMYNYNRSKITEAIALAPIAPWVVAEGQIEGYEEQYKQANTRPISVLQYRTVDLMGKPAPAPARQVAEPAIQAMAVALAQADNDIKAVTGIYDASLGQRGPDESGRAILARQHQGDVANLNLSDNFSRTLRHAGRIKLAMIPEVYDTAKVQRIIWPDQSHEMVKLNEPFAEDGMMKLYDVRTGLYDITITAGTQYQSRRAEFVQSVLSLVQAVPQTMSVVLDLLVRNMDWPGADEIADRLQAMLPPQLQKTSQGDQPVPPQFQAKLASLMQTNATLIQALNRASDIIERKKLELASKEQIAALDNLTQLIAAELKARASNAEVMVQQDFAATRHLLEMSEARENALQDATNPQSPPNGTPGTPA